MDIELIKQCADERLAPAIVEKFVTAVGAEPLSVKVTIDGKTVLLPKIENATQAADVVAAYVGKADVRFGITQAPAGVEPVSTATIDETLFEPCKNLSIGTEIFASIYEARGHDWVGDADGWFEAAMETYDERLAQSANTQAPNAPAKFPATEANDPHFAGTRVDLDSLRSQRKGAAD